MDFEDCRVRAAAVEAGYAGEGCGGVWWGHCSAVSGGVDSSVVGLKLLGWSGVIWIGGLSSIV